LYNPSGRYSYGGSGINWRAVVAMIAGILPNVPGFLAQASGGSISVSPMMESVYTYAWFVSLSVAMVVYLLLTFVFPEETKNTGSKLAQP
jgi:nucleobase:cation symporter-1, NCS1 family